VTKIENASATSVTINERFLCFVAAQKNKNKRRRGRLKKSPN
jgi:hypothetical protein